MEESHKILFYKNYKFSFLTRNGGFSKNSFESLNCSFNKGDSIESVKKNKALVQRVFCSKKKIILMNQIHSSKVVFIDKNKTPIYKADAMISNRNDITLGVLTADCAPIIILGNNFFGIIHAGWRGTIDGIIEKALNIMLKKGESEKNISIFVGPHLKKDSFEVKNDFLNNLKKSNIKVDKYISKLDENYFFDFTKLLANKIKSFKLKKFSISNIDTFSNPKDYFSHRYYIKKGIKNCGRQISLVSIKDKDENSFR